MTSSKRPPSKYGDLPISGPERRGAPLPLVTQPMIAVDHPGDSGEMLDPTRVESGERPSASAAAKHTVAMVAQPRRSHAPSVHPSSPPTEIGLSQHAVPDEDPDRRLTLMLDPDSDRAAAFRVLRHHLLELGRPQCIVVSSPRAGDGKTTTAVNLALSLAECGRAKVLLVETHLRHPELATMFGFTPPWCFAEQLAAHRHQPNMPWSLIDIPRLWLHVGAISPRIAQTQLLDGPAFAIAMERLRAAGYDHIVIDAPPVLGSADVNLMADAADAVVLALRARVSTTRDLRKAIDQLGASRVAGTVLVTD